MRRARLNDRLHIAAERSGHSQVIEPAQPFRAVAVAASMVSGTCSRSRKTQHAGVFPSHMVSVVLPEAGGPIMASACSSITAPVFLFYCPGTRARQFAWRLS